MVSCDDVAGPFSRGLPPLGEANGQGAAGPSSAFHVCVVLALRLTASEATAMADDVEAIDAEAGDAERVKQAAAWTRLTANVTALTAGTTVLVICTFVLDSTLSSISVVGLGVLVSACAVVPDMLANTAAAGMLAGFWGPTAAPFAVEEGLSLAASQAVQRRERLVRERLLRAVNARTSETGAAATIAALIGTTDPATLVIQAVQRFRCISWTSLLSHPELILDDRTLDGTVASGHLYQLSSPCELSRCDTFLSHSWHDDKELKWAALQRWCQTFEQRQGRAARLWFDKVCIDQSNIAEDLECLPIFLAGCNGMLVLSGRTYTTRLWCVLEVFAYESVGEDVDSSKQSENP